MIPPLAKRIEFSGPMVLAILRGQKWQTRRPYKNAAPDELRINEDTGAMEVQTFKGWIECHPEHKVDQWHPIAESIWRSDDGEPMYSADGTKIPWCDQWHYKHAATGPRFMRLDYARGAIFITAAKPERLVDITEQDAVSEGFVSRKAFLDYWNDIYRDKPAFQTAGNPYVFAYSFAFKPRSEPDIAAMFDAATKRTGG